MKDPNNSLILVDAHVHIQTMYDLEEYFDVVFLNFSLAAKEINNAQSWFGFLLLTEVSSINQFEKLVQLNSIGKKNKYSIQATEGGSSLTIVSPNRNKIFIIPGKQIIAKNNIEVLALCTNKKFDENQSIPTTIKEINDENGIAVLPWGVGKWTGKRKEIIENILIEHKNEKFFLGDNSGRPTFWSEPDLFKVGNQTNHFVLPGSDALAIPSEVNKTASYGFYIYEIIDDSKPAQSIKNILTNLNKPPICFGILENPFSFLKNQITMQFLKRRK
ncbi:MAG: hypothetical protein GY936_16865 [Ignavibacteriae bacterium]|nr:hypothetical protein [Ignavibacteriota bacterium]